MPFNKLEQFLTLILLASCKIFDFPLLIYISAFSVYHPSVNVNINSSLSFQIKIDIPVGLILYAEDNKTNSFISLKLLSSAKIQLDVGLFYYNSSIASISQSPLYPIIPDYLSCIIDLTKTDGLLQEWHTIVINIYKNSIILQFNHITEKINIPVTYRKLNRFTGYLGETMYFGGLPEKLKEDASHRVFFSSAIEPSFTGRISAVRIVRFISGLFLIPVMIQFQSDSVQSCYFDSNFCRYCSSATKKCTKFESITFDENPEIGYSFPNDIGREINRSIHFQFKSKQDNSFLFYIGTMPGIKEQFKNANTHFMSLHIEDGLFHVIISNPQASHPTFYTRKFHCKSFYKTCADDNWHNIELRQLKHEVIIILDDHKIEIKNAPEDEFIKTVHLKFAKTTEPFNIYRKTHLPQSPPLKQFRGCMKEIFLSHNNVKLNIIEMVSMNVYNFYSNGKLHFGKCIELFPLQPITVSGKKDYISTAGVSSYMNSKILLSFKTFKSNCLVLYQSSKTNSQQSDENFYSVEIRNYNLYFSLGYQADVFNLLLSQTNISNGLLHKIELLFEADNVIVILDNVKYIMNVSQTISNFNFTSPLYVGSVDESKILFIPHQVWFGILSQFFSGCIISLIVNDKPIQLDLLFNNNSTIKLGCKTLTEIESLNVCANQPCNEGTCVMEWDRRKCDCSRTNFTGDTCNKDAIIAEFNGYQFLKVVFPYSYKSEVENIYLKFKSNLPNGLILSTQDEFSDSTDKLEIFLSNGSVHVLLNFGKGNKKFKTHENCFDGKWHSLRLERRRKKLKVWIDENYYEFNFQSHSKVLSSDVIHVGKINYIKDQFFMGHMMHFVYNGQDYFEMAKKLSPLNIEVTASLQPSNPIKQFAINFHSVKSYLVIPKINIFGDFRLEFQMKTLRPSGLLLFLQGESNDYLILEMVNGLLHIIYNWGSGYKRKISESGLLNDGMWHSVKIVRHMSKTHSFAFRVDGIPENSRADIPVNKGGLNFNNFGLMHLGGYMENKSIITFDLETPRSTGGFQGCIASFYVNNSISTNSNIIYKDLLHEASEVKHVEENCPDHRQNQKSYCNKNSCSFGGKCIQHWSKYSCDCSLTSFTGPKCEYVSTTVHFIKHPSYIVFKYSITKKHSITQLAFGFQTNTLKETSLVAIRGSSQLVNLINIEIKIVNNYGFIQVDYNTDSGSHSFMETRLNVIDGLYHVIRFTREGIVATLKVDNLSERIHAPDGLKPILPIEEELLITVGSNSINSRSSFQGFISGLIINQFSLFDMLKEKFDSIIQLINKSNVILVQNFAPRRNDPSSIFLKQSEEEAKSVETNQKNNRLVVAKSHCPGITEDEKFQCQHLKSKGLVKPGVTYRKSQDNNNDNNNNEKFSSQETILPTTSNSQYLLSVNNKMTSGQSNFLETNSLNKIIKKDHLNINVWLITAFSCGGAFMLTALSCLIYRCSTKDEGSYNVKEDRISIQTNLHSSKLKPKINCDEKSNQSLLSNVPNKRKAKRKRSGETKEWYV